jgi:hypothetical protein
VAVFLAFEAQRGIRSSTITRPAASIRYATNAWPRTSDQFRSREGHTEGYSALDFAAPQYPPASCHYRTHMPSRKGRLCRELQWRTSRALVAVPPARPLMCFPRS